MQPDYKFMRNTTEYEESIKFDIICRGWKNIFIILFK